MIVASQRMFGILERWNNNQVTPSLSKPHELSCRSNIFNLPIFKHSQTEFWPNLLKKFRLSSLRLKLSF